MRTFYTRLKHLYTTQIVKDSVSNTILSNVSNVINYFTTLLIARILGPTGLGEITAFNSYIALLTLPISICATYITQRTAQDIDKDNRYFYLLQTYLARLGILTAGTSMLVIAFSTPLSHLLKLELTSVMLLAPGLFLSLLSLCINAILIGRRIIIKSSIVSFINSCIRFLGVIFIVWFTLKTTTIPLLFQCLGAGVTVFLGYMILKNATPRSTIRHKLSISSLSRVLRSGMFLSVVISSGTMLLISNIDVILARQILSKMDAGLYASWSFLSKVIFFALGPIIGINYVYQNTAKSDPGLQKKYFMRLFIGLLALVIPAYFAYATLGTFFFGKLFGAKFVPILPYLGFSGLYGIAVVTLTHVINAHMVRVSRLPALALASVGLYAAAIWISHPTLEQFMLVNIAYVSFLAIALCIPVIFKHKTN